MLGNMQTLCSIHRKVHFSSSSLVRHVMLNSVCLCSAFNSFIYRNLYVICKNFGWLVEEFMERNENLCNSFLVVVTGILYMPL